jgi:hypothetical protein
MAATALFGPQALRMRLLILPREHGAWGMLGIPLLTGTVIGLLHGGRGAPGFWFTVAAVGLFCLRTPVESLLGTAPLRAQTAAERRAAWLAAAGLAAIVLAALAAVFRQRPGPGLLGLGAFAVLVFCLQALLRKLGRRARLACQLLGALGLTSAAAGAYGVVAGRWNLTAVGLWLLNWMLAANQIHFVQLRIQSARLAGRKERMKRGKMFLAGQTAMLLALAFAARAGLLPALALLAFIPVLVRGALWFLRAPQPLRVRRLGLSELAHAVAFGVLLIVGFA